MPDRVFTVPLPFDYGATFLWGISGAIVGARRGYDITGVAAIALISSTGGGLLRDGIFLQNGPPALLQDPFYLIIVASAAVLVLILSSRTREFQNSRFFSDTVHYADALGLGAYAVVGMQMAIDTGISLPGVVLIGTINGAGGGILRDLVMREEPGAFKPGTLTVLAVLLSCLLFITLEKGLSYSAYEAAWPTIIMAFAIRVFSVRYNLRTRPLHGFFPRKKDN